MGDTEDDSYDAYEVVEVEEVLIDSAGYLYWKQGQEYHHVGWLRFGGRECKFQLYRVRECAKELVAVEHPDVCDECIGRVRELTQVRGCELVERRADWRASMRESCSSKAPMRMADEPTRMPMVRCAMSWWLSSLSSHSRLPEDAVLMSAPEGRRMHG